MSKETWQLGNGNIRLRVEGRSVYLYFTEMEPGINELVRNAIQIGLLQVQFRTNLVMLVLFVLTFLSLHSGVSMAWVITLLTAPFIGAGWNHYVLQKAVVKFESDLQDLRRSTPQ